MRNLQRGRKEKPKANKYIMVSFLFFIFLHWVTNFFYFFMKLGFSYSSVSEYFLGNPDKFLPQKTAMGLLEVTHIHLFTMGIVLLAVTHILALFPLSEGVKVKLFTGVFIAAFFDILSGWLITFVHPYFTYLKMASFVVFQLCLGWILVVSLFSYIRTPSVSLSKSPPHD